MTVILLIAMTLKRESDEDFDCTIIDQINLYVDHTVTSIQSTMGYKSYKNKRRITTKHNRCQHNRSPKSILAFTSTVKHRSRKLIPFDSDSDIIGIDNRCSGCISHVKEDFRGTLKKSNKIIHGFGGSEVSHIQEGTLYWTWDDDDGIPHDMVIPDSYYVPTGQIRLLSPQHWAQTRAGKDKRTGAGCDTNGNEVTLYWNNKANKRTVPIDTEGDNVATFRLTNGYREYLAYCAHAGTDHNHYDLNPPTIQEISVHSSLLRDSKLDLTGAIDSPSWPKPLQDNPFDLHMTDTNLTHGKLTHADIEETIPADHTSNPAPLPNHDNSVEELYFPDQSSKEAQLLQFHYDFAHLPFNKLREMARQGIIKKSLANAETPVCSACSFAKITKRKWRDKPSHQDANELKALYPGQIVSVDMLVSPTPGLIAQMTGFITKQRHRYATVYVDQASKYGYVYLQQTASAEETLEGKMAFERSAAAHNIHIKAYHADNGIFKARAWVEACHQSNQPLTFAAVGAHHQNGIAERRIRELQDMARTMLLHAHQRWPKAITANLWPYAVRHANACINAGPNLQHPERLSPTQLFHQTRVQTRAKLWRPFGCPVYVLESALQANLPYHKWKERAQVGIYLGMSPFHNTNVALVMNKTSGHVSPQFHVKFDKRFQTLSQLNVDTQWQKNTYFENNNSPVQTDPQHLDPMLTRTSVDIPPNPDTNERNKRPRLSAGPAAPAQPQDTQQIQREPVPVLPEPMALTDQIPSNRPQRKRKQPDRLTYQSILVHQMETNGMSQKRAQVPNELFCLSALCPHDTIKDITDPILAFKASRADPDTMHYRQARGAPDWSKFETAMQEEVESQMADGNYSIVKRTDIPEGSKVLPAVWAMKRKRDLRTGEVKKWKARLNIDGSRMEQGIHYDQTYAPVAAWSAIRLILAIAATFNWHTIQLDYVLAYSQAPVERELYMAIPAGYKIENGENRDYALKLHGNTYGQKQAGRVWFQHLTQRLIKEVGFKQSKIDECIFYKGSVIYVLYTDDSILTGPNKKEIEQIVKDIQAANLNITVEGEVKDFLGVTIERHSDGSIEFTQTLLIDKILAALHMKENTKSKPIPMASSTRLLRHANSTAFEGFDYRSVIGMLNYLDTGTRSDIAYATHQCARFTTDPKKEHGTAVNWLGRYLKGTRTKGMLFKPDLTKGLEVFVDADFSGNWDHIMAAEDRDTARSRHGYIIRYMGCPIIWKSQLQTEIALSSTESEYTGLSYALRDAIPLMNLLKEMHQLGFQVTSEQAKVHCRVFEDNSGALEMATVHKYRPRTKHLNVKLHHFREYVESGEISIHKIHTTDQVADYLTKPLEVQTFERLRKEVMGW